MTAKIIEGDILDSNAQYIAHQCNCTSSGASGVAKAIFDKYPYANIYAERNSMSKNAPFWHKPGEIYIRGGLPTDGRLVINMTSQVLPGGPRKLFEVAPGMSVSETSEVREQLFVQCLRKIKSIQTLESVAFPWKIGCGMGGGNWERYLFVINRFAELVQKDGVEVFIVKRPEDA